MAGSSCLDICLNESDNSVFASKCQLDPQMVLKSYLMERGVLIRYRHIYAHDCRPLNCQSLIFESRHSQVLLHNQYTREPCCLHHHRRRCRRRQRGRLISTSRPKEYFAAIWAETHLVKANLRRRAKKCGFERHVMLATQRR